MVTNLPPDLWSGFPVEAAASSANVRTGTNREGNQENRAAQATSDVGDSPGSGRSGAVQLLRPRRQHGEAEPDGRAPHQGTDRRQPGRERRPRDEVVYVTCLRREPQ